MKRILAFLLVVALAGGCSKEPSEKPIRKTCDAVKAAVRGIYRVESAVTNTPARVRIRSVDVEGMTADDFEEVLAAVAAPADAHVWMPSEKSWILVEHEPGARVSLSRAMEALANDESCVVSLPETFASYAGTVEEILPAFESKLEGAVLPEWFVTKGVSVLGWLDEAGVEADILKVVRDEIRSMRLVRREILKGNMAAQAAKSPKETSEACEIWARAALRNPNDPLLLERINRLESNARACLQAGKVLPAMKCFETIILIQPKNASAVHNFGLCLKKLGKTEMADRVLERAKVLSQ